MTTADIKEIAAAIGAFGGIVTVIVGFFIARGNAARDKDVKAIDVSASWQQQMLSRIGNVEQELSRERSRGDMLEQELYRSRGIAQELQWKFAREQSERISLQDRMASVEAARLALSDEVRALRSQNERLTNANKRLAEEITKIDSEIRSGHTLPPPRVLPEGPYRMLPPKPKLPK